LLRLKLLRLKLPMRELLKLFRANAG